MLRWCSRPALWANRVHGFHLVASQALSNIVAAVATPGRTRRSKQWSWRLGLGTGVGSLLRTPRPLIGQCWLWSHAHFCKPPGSATAVVHHVQERREPPHPGIMGAQAVSHEPRAAGPCCTERQGASRGYPAVRRSACACCVGCLASNAHVCATCSSRISQTRRNCSNDRFNMNPMVVQNILESSYMKTLVEYTYQDLIDEIFSHVEHVGTCPSLKGGLCCVLNSCCGRLPACLRLLQGRGQQGRLATRPPPGACCTACCACA